MSGNVYSAEGAEISAGMEVRINQRNFPINLWNLVNDPQICSISWDDRGEGILICPEAFQAEVLSKAKDKIFRTTNFISFVRQLNLYGFTKVCPDYKILLTEVSFIQHYFNPNFKRANPELLAKLKRLTPSNRAKLATGQDVSNHQSTFHPVLNSPDIPAVVENHCCIPGSLDSNMPCSQQEVAFSAHCGYYSDSYSHPQYTGQDPNWESAHVQDDLFIHLLYTVYTGQDPDPRKNHMNLDTVFDAEDEVQAADFFTLLDL
ncbi:heat shock transcription factor, Y-linked-like isoform X2 [Tachysurus fulvidraco]|uniref:heat shock transcription factor, Y-linked-like isoform X2 n=1 Tax=Tachysurus fulvidraco TaxID=1234273 RepID=UPI001FEFAD6B|nr:heat shock transcription factor, Y-linked-like isoform X2 [Tachysurus fulvidraco]